MYTKTAIESGSAFGSNLVVTETKTWGGGVRRRLNNILIHLHNYTADRYRDGGCIIVGEEVGLGGWCGIGGESTYKSVLRVVFPVIASAIALAPTSPIWLLLRLKREGKG